MAKLYEYLKVDDNSDDFHRQSFLGKMIAMYKHWISESGRKDAQEAKISEEVNKHELVLQADLFSFIFKATKPIREGKRRLVVMDIDNHFQPVLQSVLESKSIQACYNTQILSMPKPDVNINYAIRLRMEAK